MNVRPRAQKSKRKELTREERRERRLIRREKQRKDNIGRAGVATMRRWLVNHVRTSPCRGAFETKAGGGPNGLLSYPEFPRVAVRRA